MTPTAETVRNLWHALAAHFGTRTVPKHASWLMQAIAGFLALTRILPRRAFLQDFTTTIGHTMYVPFAPLDAPDAETAWSRLTLCVHEHQHVAQWQRGPVRFVLAYLLLPGRRADLEAEAYGTAIELAQWAQRPLPDLQAMALRLQHYGLGPQHIAKAHEQLLAIAARSRPESEAAKVAIAILSA